MTQVGVGDIITGVKFVWTVYESVRDGPTGAAGDFNSFRQEFDTIKLLLERIQRVEKSTSTDVRDLGVFYNDTIQECAQFVNKHKVLTQDKSSTGNSRRGSLGKKVSNWFEKVTWPLERSEAERLRHKLERCLKVATLKSTEETRDATLGFMRTAENNQLENLEMLRSIKTMTAQISLLLRRCIIDGPIDTVQYDTHHSSQRGHRLRPSGLRPEHILSGIPEDDEMPSVDSQRYQKVLDRIREISERLGNLTRRLDTHGGHGLAVDPPQPSSRKYTLDSDGPNAETLTVAAMVRFLHQVSDDVRDALETVGYGHELVPKYDPSQRHHALAKPVQSINDTAEEWEQFRHWLDFQLVHAFNTNSIDMKPSHPSQPLLLDLSPSSECLSPPIPITRTRSVESDLSIGSPQSTISIPIPDRKIPLTTHPVQVEFPDPNIPNRTLFRTLTCTVMACFNTQTHEPEAIEAVDINGGVKVTQTIIRGSTTVKSSMLPYVPSSRVPASFSGACSLWFQGSHKAKIEDQQSIMRYSISPIYKCRDRSDFENFQSVLLRRKVVACFDVRKISAGSDYYTNSSETIRVLEDPITRALSLLFFASFPGTSRRARFVDMPVNGLGIPSPKSKHIKLPFQAASRRSSVDSAASAFSQESRQSTLTSLGSSPRSKYLELEFYEERDCATFVRKLRHVGGA
ncbi:hypothetical protein BDV27DRAFT_161187 [Aspergillus caelatus]|uniref:Fungal N-terminal domain-containing protein n=1 Tax=Aspergillus caelatus TaxID=61420 RepID=A0A5N6ZTH9_9EURO|nr:uncharacterized protein BDV27DRAFT_161187 [Aspergillus caelatus]KAE8360921.1 hypothetical protein BDV27DRAFT_161187 [Aspergillus caelatus]